MPTTTIPNRIGFNLSSGRAYFAPEPDITTFELALCLDVLLTVTVPYQATAAADKFAMLPEGAKRHFVIQPE